MEVVTELQLTIEAMLRAAADPITDERLIPYQILVFWNANVGNSTTLTCGESSLCTGLCGRRVFVHEA